MEEKVAQIIVLEGLDATGKELHKNIISFIKDENSIVLKPPHPPVSMQTNPIITRNIFNNFTYPFYKNLCNLIKETPQYTYIFDRFLFTAYAYEYANYSYSNFLDTKLNIIKLLEIYNRNFECIKVIYLKPSSLKKHLKKLYKKESILYTEDYYKRVLDGYSECIKICKEKYHSFNILTCSI